MECEYPCGLPLALLLGAPEITVWWSLSLSSLKAGWARNYALMLRKLVLFPWTLFQVYRV